MDGSRSCGYYIFEFLKKWQFTFVRVFFEQKGISNWCDSPNFTMPFKDTNTNNKQNTIMSKYCFQFILCLLMDSHSNKMLNLKLPVFQHKRNFHFQQNNMGLMQNSPDYSVMKILYFSNCEISYKQIRISQFGYELRIN